MPDEFSLYGVLVPTLIVIAVLAYLVWIVVKALLIRLKFYRHVWHPALFEVALYLLILGAFFYFFIPDNY